MSKRDGIDVYKQTRAIHGLHRITRFLISGRLSAPPPESEPAGDHVAREKFVNMLFVLLFLGFILFWLIRRYAL